MMQAFRLDERDRRAIEVFRDGCRAGWRESSCLFAASLVQPDMARLRRVLYQARASEPVVFTPQPNPNESRSHLRAVEIHDQR